MLPSLSHVKRENLLLLTGLFFQSFVHYLNNIVDRIILFKHYLWRSFFFFCFVKKLRVNKVIICYSIKFIQSIFLFNRFNWELFVAVFSAMSSFVSEKSNLKAFTFSPPFYSLMLFVFDALRLLSNVLWSWCCSHESLEVTITKSKQQKKNKHEKHTASVDDFNVNFMPNFTVYRSITLQSTHILRDENAMAIAKYEWHRSHANSIRLAFVFRCNSNAIRLAHSTFCVVAQISAMNRYRTKRALYCAWQTGNNNQIVSRHFFPLANNIPTQRTWCFVRSELFCSVHFWSISFHYNFCRKKQHWILLRTCAATVTVTQTKFGWSVKSAGNVLFDEVQMFARKFDFLRSEANHTNHICIEYAQSFDKKKDIERGCIWKIWHMQWQLQTTLNER